MFTSLISAEQLRRLQQSGTALMVFDCSYDLSHPSAGQAVYDQEHIAGARHADLHQHLSSHDAQRSASAGRHPLPLREDFLATVRQWGITNTTQVVVYDRNGCNYCGRLWWMLKWLGHDAVAVLDGGLQAWKAAGFATSAGANAKNAAAAPPSAFVMHASLVELLSTEQVAANLPTRSWTLIDSRSAPRYRGEVEPLDPLAGHIPGALNRPFTDNFDSNGCFKPAAALREAFAALLPDMPRLRIAVYCGSGVSAVPNIIALELAGYARPALYAGSWSAWSTTPGLPVEKG